MGLDWKRWFISKVKLMTFAFEGQIFQFVARPGNVGNYGFNFTLRHPQSLWKAKNDEKWHFWKFGFRAEVCWAEVYWAEVFPGRSMHRAEVFTGPKYSRAEVFPGRSECRAKVVSGPNWVWAFLLTPIKIHSWLSTKIVILCRMPRIIHRSLVFFPQWY